MYVMLCTERETLLNDNQVNDEQVSPRFRTFQDDLSGLNLPSPIMNQMDPVQPR